MFDAAIIGTGPAGLSAALNLKIRNKTLIWFGSPDYSAKVGRSEKIGNYPGLGLVTGAELNQHFADHAREMGLEPTDKMVTTISRMQDHFMILADNDLFEAKTVLLATGVVTSRVFPGEEALLGHGVSYCATCDGFLYKGKTIGVFCGGPRYEHEVEYLAGLAEKVYLLTAYPETKIDLTNVERLMSPVAEILGDKRLSGIRLKDGREVELSGFFCLRGAIAPTTLMPGLETDGPHIRTDRELNTSIPGCFAAGDCVGTPYQIAKAVGEGNIAAHTMVEYLAKQKKEK